MADILTAPPIPSGRPPESDPRGTALEDPSPADPALDRPELAALRRQQDRPHRARA